jgi:hypothetical protein
MSPCHHGMARPRVADGGYGLQMWRMAANVLNKQSRTADKGWSSAWELGEGLTIYRKKQLLWNVTQRLAGSYEHGNEPWVP